MWDWSFSSDVQIWRFVDQSEELSPASFAPLVPPSPYAVTDAQTQTWNQSYVAGARGTYVPHACFPRGEIGQRTGAVRAPYLVVDDKDQAQVVRVYDFVRGAIHQIIDFRAILVSDDPHLIPFSVLLELQLSEQYLFAGFTTSMALVRLRPRAASSGQDHAKIVGKESVFYEDTFPPFTVEKSALQLFDAPWAQHRRSPSYAYGCNTAGKDGVLATRVSGYNAFSKLVVNPATEEQLTADDSLSNAIVGPIRRNHPNYLSGVSLMETLHTHSNTMCRCSQLLS